jgi:hypothetical protein
MRALYASSSASRIASFCCLNIYAQHKTHEVRMASVAFHNVNRFRTEGRVNLCGDCNGFIPVEQTRNSGLVEDVVKVNFFFFDHLEKRDMLYFGAVHTQAVEAIAITVVNTLLGKCRRVTPTDFTNVRAAVCDAPNLPVQDGVACTVRLLGK